eukprot:7224886-Alexandrium_andersonii.AAC.1
MAKLGRIIRPSRGDVCSAFVHTHIVADVLTPPGPDRYPEALPEASNAWWCAAAAQVTLGDAHVPQEKTGTSCNYSLGL